jgi:hypothetical protein
VRHLINDKGGKEMKQSKFLMLALAILSILTLVITTSAENVSIDGDVRTNDVIKNSEIKSLIDSQTESLVTSQAISYTNPITGMSVFAITFFQNIYSLNQQDWIGYSFYLPTASYVNVDVSGTIAANLSANAYTIYGLRTDDGQYSPNVAMYGMSGIFTGISTSKIFYLTKGWHTIYLYGKSTPYTGNYYTVWGSMSIVAFPEYTAITVSIPNGNEILYKGKGVYLYWKSDGKPGANVKIELYKAGILNSVISSKTPNNGIYTWYIPTYQPTGSDYKIKITSYEDAGYYDWSNGNFKIQ